MANEAGQGCIDRGTVIQDFTFVSEGGPASQDGSVNKLECYAEADGDDTITFAFFTASGNNLTVVGGTPTNVTLVTGARSCRTYNAPSNFTAFEVSNGDYLGLYTPAGNGTEQVYAVTGGAGTWYTSGDHTDASGYAFSIFDAGLDGLNADIEAVGGALPKPNPLHRPFLGGPL